MISRPRGSWPLLVSISSSTVTFGIGAHNAVPTQRANFGDEHTEAGDAADFAFVVLRPAGFAVGLALGLRSSNSAPLRAKDYAMSVVFPSGLSGPNVHAHFTHFCKRLTTAIGRSAFHPWSTGTTTVAFLPAINTPVFSAEDEARHYNHLLGRGINLGNALEASQEGAWGITLKSRYFRDIKNAGFNSVRIPISWSTHAGTQPPYAIESMFFDRVDWAVNQALSRGLVAVINVHHYVEMNRDPVAHLPRLVGMWKQIGQHYRGYPGPPLLRTAE
jgi:cellulase (glycosyl hydrolase family 5)